MRLLLIPVFALSCAGDWANITAGGKVYSVDLSSEEVIRQLAAADPRASVPAWLRPYPDAVPEWINDKGAFVEARYPVGGSAKQIAEYYRGVVEQKGLDVILRPWGSNGYRLTGSDGSAPPVLRLSVTEYRQKITVHIAFGYDPMAQRNLGRVGGIDLQYVSFDAARDSVLFRDRVSKRYFYLSKRVLESQSPGPGAGASSLSYRSWMPMYHQAELDGKMGNELLWTGEQDWEPVVTLIGQPNDGARAFAFYHQRLSQSAMVNGVRRTAGGGGIIQGYAPDGKSRYKVVVSAPTPRDPVIIEIYVAQLPPEHWVRAGAKQ